MQEGAIVERNTVDHARGTTVECKWLTGDVKQLEDVCYIIGDIRLQMCTLRDCVWHDVVLLTVDEARLLDNDFLDAPAKVNVILKSGCVATQEIWSATLHSHLKFRDARGLKLALQRMQSEVDSIDLLRELWFGGLGHCEQVQIMLDADIDVDMQSQYGRTLLHKACERGLEEMSCMLLKANADIYNVHDAFGFTPLHDAAYYGNYAICEAIINARGQVNLTDCSDYTPLHYAVLKNHDVDVVELLVNHGANMDMGIVSGWSALHMALNQNNYSVATWLISHRADPNYSDTQGFSVLHLAAKLGQLSSVEMLLEYQATVNCQTKIGETPLLYAVQQEDKPMITTLLEAKAQVHMNLAVCDLAPLNCARKINRQSIIDLLVPSKDE